MAKKAEEAQTALRQAVKRLKAAGVESAALDARLLLQGVAGVSHAELLAGRAKPLSLAQRQKLEAALERRLKHESVHRILGRRAFYGLDLTLSAETLEPRPDTEALVELLLPHIRAKAAAKARQAVAAAECLDKKPSQAERPLSDAERVTLLDIGTGSGAIALALLAEVPQLTALGVDIAEGALQTARANAESLGLAARFSARQSDCFSAVRGRFDFIISNPPYIRHADIAALADEVRLYDPLRALDGGADGLDFYRILAAEAGAHLAAGGKAAVEVGYDQAADVTALFAAAGFTLQAAQKDLGGHTRALLFDAP